MSLTLVGNYSAQAEPDLDKYTNDSVKAIFNRLQDPIQIEPSAVWDLHRLIIKSSLSRAAQEAVCTEM